LTCESKDFEFHVVETDEELDELIEFNRQVHPEDDVEELRRTIEYLPGFSREMNYYIRDVETGKIVSSANALPSTWMYEDVPLRNLELGWVGTDAAYRHRGLVRLLYSHFEEELQRGQYDISTIEGIPYFYRQFGYDFVVPMEQHVLLRLEQFPKQSADLADTVSLRQADMDDIAKLDSLYRSHNTDVLMHSHRDGQLWELQERFHRYFEHKFVTMLVEDAGDVVGYLRYLEPGADAVEKRQPFTVIENHMTTYRGVMMCLDFLREKAAEHGLCSVRINGPDSNNLCQVALAYGAIARKGWKHQVRIPDMVRFLTAIQSVLERRLRGTMFQGLTQDVRLNTYRRCYTLSFKDGQISRISDEGFVDRTQTPEFGVSEQDFVRVILGTAAIDEISEYNIDSYARGLTRHLVRTLFPKRESFVAYYGV